MTRTRLSTVLLTCISLGLSAATALAADPPAPEARIDRASAEKTALTRVPGGRIKEGELETEHGKLVWSFDIEQPGSRNIREVQVDAVSGKIVSETTETPADQAKEAAEDRAKASSTTPR